MLRRGLLPATLLLTLPWLVPAQAAGTPERWEITTKMEMEGMPFAMPGQTNRVCVPPGQNSTEKMVPVEKDCTLSNVKSTANSVSFHVECRGKQKMSGDGTFTRKGADAYSGDMRMNGVVDGQAMKMRMQFSGKKIGTCDASETPQAQVEKIKAMQDSMLAQTCQGLLNDMTLHQMPANSGLSCDGVKPKFCAKVKSGLSGNKLNDFVGEHKDWRDMAGFCGMDADAIAAKQCTAAKGSRDWKKVGLLCGDEGLAIAKEQCGGLDYTSRMSSEYAPLCDLYGDQIPLPEEKGVKGLLNKGKNVLDGVNKLRGLFGN